MSLNITQHLRGAVTQASEDAWRGIVNVWRGIVEFSKHPAWSIGEVWQKLWW